jgi:small GTP-binding protein
MLASSCGQAWDEAYIETVGVDFRVVHAVPADEGKTARLQVWDISGSPKFEDLAKSYVRGHAAVVLVFDLTRPETFDEIQRQWIPMVDMQTSDDTMRVLVGNKANKNTAALSNKAREFAASRSMRYMDVAATDHGGLCRAVEQLLRDIVQVLAA